MKTPIRSEPVTLTTTQPRWDKWRATVDGSNPKFYAESACGEDSAAHNCAVRWFFGGYTHAHGVGSAEKSAVKVTKAGTVSNCYRAVVITPALRRGRKMK